MNRISVGRRNAILGMLVEGCSIRSVERLTGSHRDTIMRLVVRAGEACRRMMDARLADLTLEHLQCDEIWTFCYKKQGRLKPDERGNDGIGDQFLFVALDEKTKLIPAFLLGKRTSENTHDFMRDVARRIRGFGPLDPTNPLASIPMDQLDAYTGAVPPMISTDGWTPYPNAVEKAFGPAVEHGVLIKTYQQSEQPGRYGPPELAGAIRQPVAGNMDPYDICTSHVERNNLTIRTFMRRFTRLTIGFSKKVENLAAAIALHVAHYNYCRYHRTIRSTPAMAAGVAGHPWTMAEMMTEAGM